ncbi:helix-turn-helix domain-containing protein [Promicromonospora sp. NPDC059942]|uniref:helix-turn-helix domain-containing protein n=1 Tax=Promicromonospora sp. NPDC059942 TaxID=3347009 RepID=UPI00364E6372
METQQTPERGLDPLLSIDELADYLGLPVRTIYAWRTAGKGPRSTTTTRTRGSSRGPSAGSHAVLSSAVRRGVRSATPGSERIDRA